MGKRKTHLDSGGRRAATGGEAAVYPDLQDKTVLVTGGASGIGAALVRGFHRQGSHVFFCDINQAAGRRLAKQLGRGVVFARVDLTKPAQIRRWIRSVGSATGAIHTLVNNAAVDHRSPLRRLDLKAWDRMMSLNLKASFITCHEALRYMRGEPLSIVNIGSVTLQLGWRDLTTYIAAKGGLLGLTRSLAREEGLRRIRVNMVSPGWVMTERQIRKYVTAGTKRFLREVQCTPDPIWPREIAEVVLFLASGASTVLTGQNIIADRGWRHG